MIAPRRPLRRACAMGHARAILPPPMRWRQTRRHVASASAPGRLASRIVQLQAHVHVHLALVSVHRWPAPPMRAGASAQVARTQRRTGRRMAPLAAPAGVPPFVRGTPGRAAIAVLPPVLRFGVREVSSPGAPAARLQPATVLAMPGTTHLPLAAATVPAFQRAPALPRLRASAARPARIDPGTTPQLFRRASVMAASPRLATPHTILPAPHPARIGRQRAGVPMRQARHADIAHAVATAHAPATLAWRSRDEGASAPEPMQWFARDLPAPPPRHGASPAAQVPPFAAGVAPASMPLDAAAADRLAEDVVRRVERRLRIERERRGL